MNKQTTLIPFNQYGSILSLEFSPDGKTLLSTSSDYTAQLWDAGTDVLLKNLSRFKSSIKVCKFSSTGTFVITCSQENIIKLWDTSTDQILDSLVDQGLIITTAFSDDDSKVAILSSVSGNYKVKIWDVKTKELLKEFLLIANNYIETFTFISNSTELLIASADFIPQIVDIETGIVTKSFQGYIKAVDKLKISSDGLSAYVSTDKTVQIWNLQSDTIKRILPHGTTVSLVALTSDGRLLLSGSNDNIVRLWNTESGEMLNNFAVPYDNLYSVALSDDGLKIISAGEKNAYLWNPSNSQIEKTYAGTNYEIALSRDGKILVSGYKVWNLSTGLEYYLYEGNPAAAGKLALSADGSIAAILTSQGKVIVWNTITKNMQCILAAANELSGASLVAISDNGKFAATTYYNRPTLIWDISTAKIIDTIDEVSTAISFNKDGSKLLTLSRNGTVNLWSIDDSTNILNNVTTVQHLQVHDLHVFFTNNNSGKITLPFQIEEGTLTFYTLKGEKIISAPIGGFNTIQTFYRIPINLTTGLFLYTVKAHDKKIRGSVFISKHSILQKLI